jgi:hypothetical protein
MVLKYVVDRNIANLIKWWFAAAKNVNIVWDYGICYKWKILYSLQMLNKTTYQNKQPPNPSFGPPQFVYVN